MNRRSPHASHRRAAHRGMAMGAVMCAALIGCQSPPPHSLSSPQVSVPAMKPAPTGSSSPNAPPGAAAPVAATPGDIAPGDGYYDWHSLLIAPFGTALKEIPLVLHEVLLFRDEAHAAGSEDAADCYAADAPAPIFAGRRPQEYTLCFARDRLARIEASVRLTTAEAPGLFAAACAEWMRNASAAGAADCAGRAGAIRFSGRLGQDTDRPGMEPAESTMSITLDGVTVP